MTKKLKVTAMAFALMLGTVIGFGFSGGQALASDRGDIEAAIKKYERALGASDVDSIVKLYTTDGVFMSPNNQPAVGAEQIRAAYTAAFKMIDIDNPKFGIKEIVLMTDDWAFVRSLTFGTATIIPTGAVVSGTNSEVFIFHKDKAKNWKIARYIFSTTDPRR